jgi:hypothetical protein
MELFAQDVTGAARLGQLIVNCLAVGGGFLVGWFVCAAANVAFDRFLIHRKSPRGLHKATRNTGGLALAVLVAFIVFGHGHGWTLFGGGGPGDENGGKVTVAGPKDDAPKSDDKTVPVALKDVPPVDERIRVVILGGDDVKAERFYVVDDALGPKTFAEATVAILARRSAAAGKRVGVEIRFPQANALPQDHPAVTRLARWVRTDAGLTVSFPAD